MAPLGLKAIVGESKNSEFIQFINAFSLYFHSGMTDLLIFTPKQGEQYGHGGTTLF